MEQQIDYYSRLLRLPAFRTEYAEQAKSAAKSNHSFERYLLDLMITEYDGRLIRRKKQRIRRAGFPYKKQIHDLIKSELPNDAQNKLATLERLDFIKDGQNLILAGNPGTGWL